MGNLKDKVAFVTGASGGLGKDIAIGLAKDGCKVICVSRSLEGCEVVAGQIREMGLSAEAYACDVSKFEDVQACAKIVLEKYGRVDIVINNAGIVISKILLVMKPEEWQSVIDTNITGCFNVTKVFSKSMFKNNWGRVVNISSVAGVIGNPGQTNYSAAKSAMMGFTKSLVRECYGTNIVVNNIAPGYLDNDMVRKNLNDGMRESVRQRIPMRRMGSNQDIVNACLFLCQEEIEYIRGQTILVDGGLGLQLF